MTIRAHERAVTRLLNDQKELEFMRKEVAALHWRNAQLEAEIISFRKALEELWHTYYDADITDEMMENVYILLQQTTIEVCSCGHPMSDHDRNGCCWLHCRTICDHGRVAIP